MTAKDAGWIRTKSPRWVRIDRFQDALRFYLDDYRAAIKEHGINARRTKSLRTAIRVCVKALREQA
jgi:hypothetical protein